MYVHVAPVNPDQLAKLAKTVHQINHGNLTENSVIETLQSNVDTVNYI